MHVDAAGTRGLLNVPHLQVPHHATGRGAARHFDTRSLNEENFIASIGVYTTPAPWLHVHCEISPRLPTSSSTFILAPPPPKERSLVPDGTLQDIPHTWS